MKPQLDPDSLSLTPPRENRLGWRGHLILYGWCLHHIPMVVWLAPRILERSAQRCVVKIPLNWRSRNHLGSMYFGALCVGADLAGALLAMDFIRPHSRGDVASYPPLSLVFKDMRAVFVRRAEQHTLFVCEDGPRIKTCIDQAHASAQRQSVVVMVKAYEEFSHAEVAKFELTLSMKSAAVVSS